MKVLIFGATGVVGGQLLRAICDDQAFTEVVAVTRKPIEYSSPKVIQYSIQSLTDLLSLSEKTKKDLKADVIFCCLGTTIKAAGSRENFEKVDFGGVHILGILAEDLQIPHFVLVSAAGANKNSKIFYYRIKGLAEEDLIKRKIPQITIFRPGLLLTDRKEFRLGEFLAIKAVRFIQSIGSKFSEKLVLSFATDVQVLVKAMLRYASNVLPNSISSNKVIQIIEAVQLSQK